MTECIDLKARYGRSYRVSSEDGNSRNTDTWLWQLLCANGHIYPHGGDRLGAATSKRGPLIGKLLSVPSARMEQNADDGANVSFAAADFKAVAAIMRPRRRRQLTAEQRQAAAERLKDYAFPARQNAQNGIGQPAAV